MRLRNGPDVILDIERDHHTILQSVDKYFEYLFLSITTFIPNNFNDSLIFHHMNVQDFNKFPLLSIFFPRNKSLIMNRLVTSTFVHVSD